MATYTLTSLRNMSIEKISAEAGGSEAVKIGAIGEKFALEYLEKNGYIVCDYRFPPCSFTNYLDFDFSDRGPLGICRHIRCTKKIDYSKCKFLWESYDGFCHETVYGSWEIPTCPCTKAYLYSKICSKCDYYPCLVIKLFQMGSQLKKMIDRGSLNQLWDFVAHKDGKHFFVEVKTNKFELKKVQRIAFGEVCKIRGVESLLLKVHLGGNIEEKHFR